MPIANNASFSPYGTYGAGSHDADTVKSSGYG